MEMFQNISLLLVIGKLTFIRTGQMFQYLESFGPGFRRIGGIGFAYVKFVVTP